MPCSSDHQLSSMFRDKSQLSCGSWKRQSRLTGKTSSKRISWQFPTQTDIPKDQLRPHNTFVSCGKPAINHPQVIIILLGGRNSTSPNGKFIHSPFLDPNSRIRGGRYHLVPWVLEKTSGKHHGFPGKETTNNDE